MKAISHPEFGEIIIKRSQLARGISARVNLDGQLVITTARLTPIRLVHHMVRDSADDLRQLLATRPQIVYQDKSSIGYDHTIEYRSSTTLAGKITGNTIVIGLPPELASTRPEVQATAREYVKKALRKEAKIYLPKRLKVLAARHGYGYRKTRIMHASTRWGSCSSTGTISLNIALMKLPLELIDYVLIHELCHTKQLDHSARFWSSVETILPNYKSLRRRLKAESPAL